MRQIQARFAFLTMLLGCVAVLHAEENLGEEKAQSQSLASKFKFFGYLNVAYGETDGHDYRGATNGGTFDFRTAALQLRFAPSASSEFVVQLANESVGESPTNELRDDLELDWLFYRHRFAGGTQVRVGRVPLPIGIYNEIKDVGVALPFYRPSDNFYGEGTWTSDSVDGIVLTHNLDLESEWSFQFDVYYGDWERIETDGNSLRFAKAEINDALGFFTWISPPNSGVRVGFGYNRFEASGGVFLAPGVVDEEETSYFSFDASFEPWTLHFEASRREFTGGHWQPYYLELGVQVASRVKLNALYDVGELYYEIPFFATFDGKIEELWGLSVNYEIRPGWVAKIEHRWTETYGQIEDQPISIFFDEPVKVKLLIASMAVSF